MIWEDFLVERPSSQAELENSLAIALGVSVQEVEVVSSMEQSCLVPVICHVQHLGGQFPLMASLYLDSAVKVDDKWAFLRRISERMNTRLLVATDDPDPYAMTLIHGEQVRTVKIDPVALDEREEYILV